MNRGFAFALMLLTLPAGAEIYRWTDADGRVHFGDQPGEQSIDAEPVTVQDYKPGSDEQVRQIYERRKRLVEAGKSSGAQADQERRAQAERARAQAGHCQESRERLQHIAGPVVFLDGEGKAMKISEQERARMAAELEGWIKAHCP